MISSTDFELPRPSYVAPDMAWEVHERLIDPATAQEAGTCAMVLLGKHEELEFVNICDDKGYDSRFWAIGVWPPKDTDDTGTIYAFDDWASATEPLLRVMNDVNGKLGLPQPSRDRESGFLYFIGYHPGMQLALHPDQEQRTITGLLGEAEVGLYVPDPNGLFRFRCSPGDSYTMNVDEQTGLTPHHLVKAVGSNYRLVMMR